MGNWKRRGERRWSFNRGILRISGKTGKGEAKTWRGFPSPFLMPKRRGVWSLIPMFLEYAFLLRQGQSVAVGDDYGILVEL